jgi:hypothetical protein
VVDPCTTGGTGPHPAVTQLCTLCLMGCEASLGPKASCAPWAIRQRQVLTSAAADGPRPAASAHWLAERLDASREGHPDENSHDGGGAERQGGQEPRNGGHSQLQLLPGHKCLYQAARCGSLALCRVIRWAAAARGPSLLSCLRSFVPASCLAAGAPAASPPPACALPWRLRAGCFGL